MFGCRSRMLVREAMLQQLMRQQMHQQACGSANAWVSQAHFAHPRAAMMLRSIFQAEAPNSAPSTVQSTLFNRPTGSEVFHKVSEFPSSHSDHSSSFFSWLHRRKLHRMQEHMERFQEFSKMSMPKVDLIENKTAYIIKADIPAYARNKVKLEARNNHTLTLEFAPEAGEAAAETAASESAAESAQAASKAKTHADTQEHQYIMRERDSASDNTSFKRIFRFENAIDGSAVTANYKDGVLTVELPKQISVKNIEIGAKA